MSKAVMISIQPRWCALIANGEKTIEIRKTRPKLETPFKCYIYCTKAKERLLEIMKDGDENYGGIYHGKPVFIKTSVDSVCDMYGKRQKVIGEFVCDKIYELAPLNHSPDNTEQKACLSREEIVQYLKGRGWGWNISDLKIYDKTKEISEFKKHNRDCYFDNLGLATPKCSECTKCNLTRAPQSWCYVEEFRT